MIRLEGHWPMFTFLSYLEATLPLLPLAGTGKKQRLSDQQGEGSLLLQIRVHMTDVFTP